jgi:RimJ/RimL family protein N-acetyltransferase
LKSLRYQCPNRSSEAGRNMLNGPGFRLRSVEPEDVGFLWELRNDFELQLLWSRQPFVPVTMAEVQGAVDASSASLPGLRSAVTGEERSIELVIEADDKPIGVGGLYQLDFLLGTCELGVAINDRAYQNKGLGTVVHHALIEYAFLTLGLRKVVAQVHADNARVVRLCERLGFVEEGHLRNARWVQGKFVDLIVFGLFLGEWKR